MNAERKDVAPHFRGEVFGMENGKTGQERRIEREAQWRKRIEEQSRSGLSVRAFCRHEGITEPSFYDWRRRLGQSARAGVAPSGEGASVAPAFARVVMAMNEEPNPRLSRIEIECRGGRVIRVGPGFDRATLIEALSVIEAGGR